MAWTTAATLPWEVAACVGIAAAILASLAIERLSFRPVRGAEPTTLLLTSFGASLVVQNLILLIAGPRPISVNYSSWTSAAFTPADIRIGWLQLATFGTTIVCLLALNLILKRTLFGIALRAASEDFTTTRLMGVRANRIAAGAFALSGLLAGLAAVFWFANASLILPSSGFVPVMKGFICAVIGGLGSLTGAVVVAYALAATETALGFLLPSDYQPYGEALVFALVILFLSLRPDGLFGSKGRLA